MTDDDFDQFLIEMEGKWTGSGSKADESEKNFPNGKSNEHCDCGCED